MLKFSVIATNATYQLIRNQAGVNEGSTFTITLNTTGVQNGQAIPYVIAGIQQADITEPLSGTFLVQNGQSNKTFSVIADSLTEGTEIFTLTLSDVTSSTASVTIADTSLSSDPYFSSVKLLMHMDTSVTSDVKGHAIAITGNTALSTTQVKSGTHSARFDGNSRLTAAASADWNLGSTYTVEGWFWFDNMPVTEWCRFIMIGPNGSASSWMIQLAPNGSSLYAGVPSSSVPNYVIGGSCTIPSGEWVHIAVTSSVGSGRVFVNGNIIAQGPIATQSASSTNPLYIGYDTVGTVSYKFRGYVDELRVTKGIARYTTTFVPQSSPFVDA